MVRKEVAMARVQERKMKRPALFIALTSADSISEFYYIAEKVASLRGAGASKNEGCAQAHPSFHGDIMFYYFEKTESSMMTA